MKNYLWNALAIIKNGQISKKSFISINRKKICESILSVLWDEGFILGYEIQNKKITVNLKYINEKPAIKSIKSISKPGKRIYYSSKQIWKIDSTKNFIIFSTTKGVLSINDCKKLKIGGEPIILII